MPTLLIIAPTFAIAEQLAASRQYAGDWHWFTSATAAGAWLDRCREHGIQIEPSWITYQWPTHPDMVRRTLKARTDDELAAMLTDLVLEVPVGFTLDTWRHAVRVEQRRRLTGGSKGRLRTRITPT